MDFHTTKRDDFIVGTDNDDTFTALPGGGDAMFGGAGYDTLKIDYSETESFPYLFIPNYEFYIAANGELDGSSYEGTRGTLEFDRMDRVTVLGSVHAEKMFLHVQSTAQSDMISWNGGGGDDYVQVDFQAGGDQHWVTRENGRVDTSIGDFRNIAHVSVIFSNGSDVGVGGVGNDVFLGAGGDDQLSGGAGNDVLVGGLSVDQLRGGAGADVFEWNAVAESNHRIGADTVLDFNHTEGDQIDLRDVDAGRGVKGVQHFTFIDQAAFTGADGSDYELRQQINSDGTVTLMGDTNHDGKANFVILIHTDEPLVAADLIF